MSFDANVIAYYPCDTLTGGVVKDEVGGYDAEQIGTLTFDTSKKPNAWSKGMVAYSTPASNYFKTPLSLNTVMSGKAAFSIQFQFRLNTGYSGTFYTIFAKRFLANATKRLMFDFGAPAFRSFFSALNSNAFNYNTVFNDTPVHYSFEWTGTQIKIYENGTLKFTANSQTVNSFADVTNKVSWLYEPDLGYGNVGGAYLSDILISDIARGGVNPSPVSSPTITGISPASGYPNGGEAVSITGTEFASGAAVTFDGDAATDIVVVSDTEITCVAPAHALGAVDVVVTNTDTGTVTETDGYTYIGVDITSIAPTGGSILGGTPVILTGLNFVTGTLLTVGGVATDIDSLSATEIAFTTPEHAAGEVVIEISYGGSSDSTTFMYRADELYKPTAEFIVKLNNRPVNKHSFKSFVESQELNIIDNYDYAFDGVDIEIPLPFVEHFNGGDELAVFHNGIKIYKGYVSAQRFSHRENKVYVSSLPYTDQLSKRTDTFNLSVQNPVSLLSYLFTTYLPSEYTVGNIIAQSNNLSGISVTLNTDVATENVKALINNICETFDIGVYQAGLIIKVLAVPINFPKGATLINAYLMERPDIEEVTDLYYNKVSLKYETAFEAGEATVTAGTGDFVYEFTLEKMFCTATVAQAIADRKLSILNRYYYTLETSVKASIPLKIGDYFSYLNYTFLITGLEKEGVAYKLKAKGVKNG